jgi:hypothetical protein
MSKPLGYNARQELISAMSSLNMEVSEYTGPTRKDNGDVIYLSEANPDAAHSMEHMDAATDILTSIRRDDIPRLRRVVNGIINDMGGWDILPFEKWEEFDDALREIEEKI